MFFFEPITRFTTFQDEIFSFTEVMSLYVSVDLVVHSLTSPLDNTSFLSKALLQAAGLYRKRSMVVHRTFGELDWPRDWSS